MLNRKLSNYIYYGVIAFVILLIFVVRAILVGSINGKIDDLEKENVELQKQITALNEIVQDNSDTHASLIYDLNKHMPSVYSAETLSNKIYSKLDRLGITESFEFGRSVNINESASVSSVEQLSTFDSYGVVEIAITFSINDISNVYSLIDSMNDDDQLFILNRVSYTLPEGEEQVTISLSYYAFYNDIVDTQ